MSRPLWLAAIVFVAQCFGKGGEPTWNYKDEIELKKDELARYNIAIDNKIFVLEFRWTLFVNKGLVVLYKYDKFVNQNILYEDHKLKSFKIPLKNRAQNAFYEPYALISFKSFDNNAKRAEFELLLRDDMRSISAERVLPRAE